MGMNDGLAERKPKPKTSAAVANRIAPSKKHFKNTFLQFIRDTGTIIADAYFGHIGEMTLKDNSPHGCIFSFTVPLSEVNLNE